MTDQTDLIEAYGDLSSSLIQKVGEAAEQAFFALPNYRGKVQRQEYVALYEDILFGARIEAARLAVGFHREIALAQGKKFRAPKLRKEDFFPYRLRQQMEAMGGSGLFEPYQTRPFRELYYALSRGSKLTEAVTIGGARARILAQTDVQLARRKASLFARRENDNIVGYIRVLTGAESCGLCYVASTQRYNKDNLNPIHPGCDCGELPIYGDSDPGQIIDQYNLDRIHESFEKRFGVDDPGARDLGIGKAVEYKDGVRLADYTLISIRENGELGPVLTRRKDNFETLDDIKRRIKERERAKSLGMIADAYTQDYPDAGLRSPYRQVLKRLDAAETTAKVESIMAEALGNKYFGFGDGQADSGFKLYNLPDQFAKTKEVAKTLLELQRDYPVPLAQVIGPGSVGPKPGVFADANRFYRRMRFYADYWENPEEITENFEYASETGHFPQWVKQLGIDPMKYITTHEYGHIIDYASGLDVKPRTIARRLLAKISNVSPNQISPVDLDDFVVAKGSSYSLTNAREFIAEAFTDFHLRGDAATDLSKEVMRFVLEDVQKKVKEEAFKIAKQVTDSEVNELATKTASNFTVADLADTSDGDIPGLASAAFEAIALSGIIGKKAGLVSKVVNYAAQEAAAAQLVDRIKETIKAQARQAAERAS